MKFSLKLLLCTLVVMAIGFGFSGYYFVDNVFQTSLEREVRQALDENSILRFALETAALNVPAKYDVLQDQTVEQIAYNLETGGQSTGRLLRITDENHKVLYASHGFFADEGLPAQATEGTRSYRLIQEGGGYYIQTGATVNALDRTLFLETMKDVSEVFKERSMGFSVYRRVTVIMLIFGMIVMYFISLWLTRPIRLLTRATKRMAQGNYDYRARQVTNDELGQLTTDFNNMANALEDNISMLEEEIRSREDFVAAFAHELKTPLTAIIGYADMLRSRRLDEEKSFMSANYIYTEGKRLEAMSFRLLEIMVTKRSEIRLQPVFVDTMFRNLYQMYVVNKRVNMQFTYDKAMVEADPDLLLSVLINILDNGCKASEPGSPIKVRGILKENGYRFAVRDYGIGIPEEEQNKITKAFYMVDKSRARSKNGAGLGLALCAEILQLHNSSLEIESSPGKGSCISFVLPVAYIDRTERWGG